MINLFQQFSEQRFPRRQVLRPYAMCFFHSDTTKASMVAALRHSRDQPEKTYNRQTANKRKDCALCVAREYAQDVISKPAMTETTHTSTVSEQPPVTTNIKLAQFVALLEEKRKLRGPKILISQVHSFLDNAKVSLLWYKAYKNHKLEIDGEQ